MAVVSKGCGPLWFWALIVVAGIVAGYLYMSGQMS